MKTTAYFQATIKFVNCVHVCYVLQMYICLISIHALYMTIHHFIVCVQADWKGSNDAHLLTKLHIRAMFVTYMYNVVIYCI